MKRLTDESKYKPRIIDSTVERYLKLFGAICIEGPKWCGKTWTSSHHCKSDFMIGDPENNFQNRRLAELSPDLVLAGETPRLLDEWQEVPSIWDAVRYKVDERGEKGQFILTGSSTPKTKGIMHSGTGRIGKIRMRTMSLYESGDSSGLVSLKDLCNGEINQSMTGEVSLQKLAYLIVRGGWPGNIGASAEDASVLPQSYIDSVLNDDSKRLDGVKYDRHKMHLLLMSLARNESTTATMAKLISDIKAENNNTEDDSVNRDTVPVYIDAFTRLFLLDNLLPFSANLRSPIRVKQAEKRHFCDPALACALLKATPERLVGDLETFGFMFESLVERDLKIYAESFGASVYHYQGYNNKEIDAVVELDDGRWCAFEIKLGANQIDKAASNLISISRSIEVAGGVAPSVLCVICGLSNAAYKRPDGVFVVPITALKN